MSRLFRIIFLSFPVLLTVLYFSYLSSPVTSLSTKKAEFIIESGQNLDQITSNLAKQKIIRSASAAKVTILMKGISKDIQAGYFYLSPSNNLSQIVSSLTEASSKQTWITIPEGLRREEIVLIIRDSFTSSSADSNFNIQDFLLITQKLEGHLFPETYAFDPNSSAKTVVLKLTNQLDEVVQDLSIPPTKIESTLILASLLEREARNPSEMLEIAGILKKRLAAGWPLQIDATIQFALATQTCSRLDCNYWSKNLSRNDLGISSPYNTYKHTGLPPGPIANPGRESIKASFQATSSDYWFYLHDPDGQIHYAKTVEEHNQNVCLYLKKDCFLDKLK